MKIIDIATAINALTESDLEKLAENLNFKTSDKLYRILHMPYVKEDIKSMIDEMEIDTSDYDLECLIDNCASRYVYDGDYDCNLSYWDNIKNIIINETI